MLPPPMKTRIPFLKLFNSSSNYFDNKKRTSENRPLVLDYLMRFKEYTLAQACIYQAAYDYFSANPLDYDGATATEDLYDFKNLELAAVGHDYFYIQFNVAGNLKYRLMVDKLFRQEMKRMNKSSWNRGARFVLLMIILLPHTAYSYLFKGRKMTYAQKISMDGFITVLSHRTPRKWYKEFKGELTWIVICIILITFVMI